MDTFYSCNVFVYILFANTNLLQTHYYNKDFLRMPFNYLSYVMMSIHILKFANIRVIGVNCHFHQFFTETLEKNNKMTSRIPGYG
jgi:hypothetical protein